MVFAASMERESLLILFAISYDGLPTAGTGLDSNGTAGTGIGATAAASGWLSWGGCPRTRVSLQLQ